MFDYQALFDNICHRNDFPQNDISIFDIELISPRAITNHQVRASFFAVDQSFGLSEQSLILSSKLTGWYLLIPDCFLRELYGVFARRCRLSRATALPANTFSGRMQDNLLNRVEIAC